ncbi:MAG TPA: carboxylesterase family protein [Rhodothermales bacterium]|nr:carboxylesterase family protein [Rhodothermales bacterium]
MKTLLILSLLAGLFVSMADAQVVQTAHGSVEGIMEASGVQAFKGLPYAAPPIRDLRWKPPQPAANWDGTRHADRFGPQCMQARVFGDMMFRSEGMSEDCLYLNVWTPATSPDEPLPVLVYFYGGGFIAGDGSEPRYDGESMAQKGIVTVTLNYRLGIFGFFVHPELTAESPHGASGNYGLLDQTQALRWVQENIAAFGGDPARVTIAGESAGSASVSAQMASPLSKDLIAGAIGESGALMGARPLTPLAEAEQTGVQFADRIGAASLEALRALSATQLLELASQPGTPRFPITVDGYLFTKQVQETFANGEQAHVPLLLGWNSQEMPYQFLLGQHEPTPENFAQVVRDLYGEHADTVLALYPASTVKETKQSATDLAGDRFIGFSTWKWSDLHRQTSDAPMYRYFYAHPRPPMRPEMGDAVAGLAGGVVRDAEAEANQPPPPTGAVHSAEIEYAMGNLATNPVYAWTKDDYAVSKVMQEYFANFIKTGDPNGPDLSAWPDAGSSGDEAVSVMRIDVNSQAKPEQHRDRYLFLDEHASQ